MRYIIIPIEDARVSGSFVLAYYIPALSLATLSFAAKSRRNDKKETDT